MKIDFTVTAAIFDGSCFNVFFAGDTPCLNRLSIIVGYAKREQKNSGRTCFAISNTENTLSFKPVNPTSNEKSQLLSDLIALMDNIGFETTAITATKRSVRRPSRVPVAAHK